MFELRKRPEERYEYENLYYMDEIFRECKYIIRTDDMIANNSTRTAVTPIPGKNVCGIANSNDLSFLNNSKSKKYINLYTYDMRPLEGIGCNQLSLNKLRSLLCMIY